MASFDIFEIFFLRNHLNLQHLEGLVQNIEIVRLFFGNGTEKEKKRMKERYTKDLHAGKSRFPRAYRELIAYGVYAEIRFEWYNTKITRRT